MDIKCPHCGEKYIAEANEYGKFVKCETCGRGFTVFASAMKGMGIMDAARLVMLCAANAKLGAASTKESGGYWTPLSGRATRREYWGLVAPVLIIVFFITIAIAIRIVGAAIHNGDPGWGPPGIILFVVVVALVYNLLTIPVTVRRLHDRNMSGWFLLAFFVGSLIPVAGWFVQLVQFIIIGCLDGTVGPNEFGPDPKGRKPMQPQFVVSPSSIAGHESPEDRLLKLQKLKEAGIVSEEEYEGKRRKLLAEI